MVARHDFKTSLTRSERDALKPFWRRIYQEAFPDFESMSDPITDLTMQRRGIDRIITLAGGKTLYIDEKLRPKTWTDVLLEKWSSVEHSKPGWAAKPLHCDYVAYAFEDSCICYVIPFQQLRRAWEQHGAVWEQRYGIIPADNGSYTTICVPVPIGVLLSAIRDTSMWVNWALDSDVPY